VASPPVEAWTELRRLLWRLVLVVPQTVRHILAWSQWRRRHQSVAQYYHYKLDVS